MKRKRFSLRRLFHQGGTGSGNFGHEGRPGLVGGSSDEGSSHSKSSKERRELRSILSDAEKFEKGLPKKLGSLSNPKSVAELKTGLRTLKGKGDKREEAKEILTGSGWRHVMRDEVSGADVYKQGSFITEVYFGRGKTQVQFRKQGHSYQSL